MIVINFIDNNAPRIHQDHKILFENLIHMMTEFREDQERKRQEKLIKNWSDAFFGRKK